MIIIDFLLIDKNFMTLTVYIINEAVFMPILKIPDETYNAKKKKRNSQAELFTDIQILLKAQNE